MSSTSTVDGACDLHSATTPAAVPSSDCHPNRARSALPSALSSPQRNEQRQKRDFQLGSHRTSSHHGPPVILAHETLHPRLPHSPAQLAYHTAMHRYIGLAFRRIDALHTQTCTREWLHSSAAADTSRRESTVVSLHTAHTSAHSSRKGLESRHLEIRRPPGARDEQQEKRRGPTQRGSGARWLRPGTRARARPPSPPTKAPAPARPSRRGRTQPRAARRAPSYTAMQKLRIVILAKVWHVRDRKWSLNDGQIRNPSARL